MSVDGDKAFSNKIHIECLRSLIDENGAGFWEYSPFGGERPNTEIRLREAKRVASEIFIRECMREAEQKASGFLPVPPEGLVGQRGTED